MATNRTVGFTCGEVGVVAHSTVEGSSVGSAENASLPVIKTNHTAHESGSGKRLLTFLFHLATLNLIE